jgi:hypothetical protein
MVSNSQIIGAAAKWTGATSAANSATIATPTEPDLLKILHFRERCTVSLA